MHTFTRLITLPLLMGTMISMAKAEALTPEMATELLAKSQVIDRRCTFLSTAEHSELSNLVARAEIALAEQQSVADASAALARGKAKGKDAGCTDTEKAEVIAILTAAKTASAQIPEPQIAEMAPAEPQKQMVAPVEPQTGPMLAAAEPEKIPPVKTIVLQPKKRTLPTQTKKIAVKKLTPKNNVALATYANLTKRYYLQRRCGTMGSQAINALYQNVVATHQRTLQAFGKASTAAAMRRAEAQASAQSCS